MSAEVQRKIVIPRWVQLVGLPLLAIAAWRLIATVDHAVFIFVVATLIAILLNPVVRGLGRLRVPRPLAVFVVFVGFLGVLVGLSVVAGTVVAREVSSVSSQIEDEFTVPPGQTRTPAELKLDRFQHWLDGHGLGRIDVQQPGRDAIHQIDTLKLQQYSGRAVDLAQTLLVSVFEGLFNLVLVIVISVYMLLDAPRLSRFLRRIFPGTPGGDDDLVTRAERALVAYVRGQTLVSLVIGATAGVGMYVTGLLGVFHGGSEYALAFGAWATVTEAIPYVGPWIGALAPAAVAATESLTAVIAVAVVYLFVHQVEGHVVIPKLMGNAVKVHPLAVIFTLLAAGELYGVPGVLVALPLLAVVREALAFLAERIDLESWRQGGVPEVQVELEGGDPAHEPGPTAEPVGRVGSHP